MFFVHSACEQVAAARENWIKLGYDSAKFDDAINGTAPVAWATQFMY
ncbi:hypothetical protein SAMN05519103_09387 [Rhizobiales bacterium GAS113]|nr:hypothetical protein SAMN05519103_09387 [Rhizobiales bacterium GAS113]SEF03643.1 hypothetical protein SAMN05519104_7993 [Rhizobiales bacterium GAS188]